MSAVETYDQVCDQLGRRDRVSAQEELKGRAVAMAQVVGECLDTEPDAGASGEQQRDSLLLAMSAPADALLAVALPLVEYGDASDHAAIAQALQHVADCGMTQERGVRIPRLSAVVALGRLAWALTAYALTTRRIDALVALAGVGTLARDDERPLVAIFDDRTYRYPDALGGNAGNAYRDYHDWLASRELVAERLPYLASTLDVTFGEADLLLALRMQANHPGRTYSGGKRNHPVRRLALRFRDPRQRQHLGDFFAVGDAVLDEHVDRAYLTVEYDRDFTAPDLPARMLGTD